MLGCPGNPETLPLSIHGQTDMGRKVSRVPILIVECAGGRGEREKKILPYKLKCEKVT